MKQTDHKQTAKPTENNSTKNTSFYDKSDIMGALNDLSNSRMSPSTATALQRTMGNQFLLTQLKSSSTKPLQLFRDKATWVTDSDLKNIFGRTKNRSAEVIAIDNAIEAYEPLRDSNDYEAREEALFALTNAIQVWRNKKGDVSGVENKPSMQKKRWQYISVLMAEIRDEQSDLSDLKNERRLEEERVAQEEKQKIIGQLIPQEVRTIEDLGERANRIFSIYMAHFKGTASYTLKTVPGASMYNDAGTIACATISAGLRDAFRFAGIESKVEQIPSKYFITKPIGSTFMDTGAVGNVKTAENDYAGVKRFFFSAHWIVSANGNQYFDPTSGIPVSSTGIEIVDPKYTGFTSDGINYKKGDEMKLTTLIDQAPSGSGYLLEEN